MTSCELTSGHLGISAWSCCIFVQNLMQISSFSRETLAFHEIQYGRRLPRLSCLLKSWDHPERSILGGYIPCKKFRHGRRNNVKVISIWIFVVHAWKSYWWAQKFSIGVWFPKFKGTSFRSPKGTPRMARFETDVFGPDRTCRTFSSIVTLNHHPHAAVHRIAFIFELVRAFDHILLA